MSWNRRILACIILLALLAVVLLTGYFRQDSVEAMGRSEEDKDKKKIALTFDDGPHPYYTDQLLDGLKERGVKATFFVTGEHAKLHPEVIKRMSEEGD